jgi:uncharacterized repeat protein (TIGR04138 family)
MNEEEFLRWLETQETKYHPNAYQFVLAALKHSQRHFDRPRHMTGQELLKGISELAKREFGPFVLTVLHEWGIRTTRDFGNIVFQLVEAGEIKKTDEDHVEDFDNVYDFAEEFTEVWLEDRIRSEA